MSARKIHLRDLRLRNNAGILYPACYASSQLLDTDKARLQSVSNSSFVSCKHCIRIINKEQLQ